MVIPLGILASAHTATGPQDRLRRVNSARTGLSNTITVNFTEPTPLDSTHLLVAIVHWGTTTAPTVPSGWTEITTDGSASDHIYVRQGNGSVNGITVATASGNTNKTMFLLAFEGYVSLTEVTIAGATDADSNPPYVMPTLSSTPNVYGVAIAFAATTNVPSAWSSWSNGYSFTGGSAPASATLYPGYKEYTGSSGSYGSTLTTTGGGAAYNCVFVMQLTP